MSLLATLKSWRGTLVSSSRLGAGQTIDMGWDDRGNRAHDDNLQSSFDRRDYTYDGRRRVKTVSGKARAAFFWFDYVITSAYDHRDRRVFRSYKSSTGDESQWYFYYDVEDRLIEIKYIPIVSNPTNYQVFQFYWLDKRPVAQFVTFYPSATTSRFFLHADHQNRPLEMFDWPTTGNSTLVWAINPSEFGWDDPEYNYGFVFQPLRLNAAYQEEGTRSLYDVGLEDRPSFVSMSGILFDPMTASDTQRVGAWPNESYSHRVHSPIKSLQLQGPVQVTSAADTLTTCRSTLLSDTCLNCGI